MRGVLDPIKMLRSLNIDTLRKRLDAIRAEAAAIATLIDVANKFDGQAPAPVERPAPPADPAPELRCVVNYLRHAGPSSFEAIRDGTKLDGRTLRAILRRPEFADADGKFKLVNERPQ